MSWCLLAVSRMEQRIRPVFVIGCHRSGTNLLYDTLLSAGGFAVYRGYLPVYKMLIPRFGSFGWERNRRRMLDAWLRSKGFRRSGLEPEFFRAKVLGECRSGGEFIRLTMDEIARRQNAVRWAVYDPDNVLFIRQIKRDLPEALFVHIIRDGRDIALSLRKMGGFQPLPWDRGELAGLEATALYWEWMVRKGRKYGREFGSDYIEVHYEDLVQEPRRTLEALGKFLAHDLDYDCVQAAGLGRVSRPNSSFEREEHAYQPLERWKARLSNVEVCALEAIVGRCLEEFDYKLTRPEPERRIRAAQSAKRREYFGYLNTKLWLKTQTPAGAFADLSALELNGTGQDGGGSG